MPALEQSGRWLVYLAAERTLLSWIRASIALIVLGFAVDRFGLLLARTAPGSPPGPPWSLWVGLTLMAAGVLASVLPAIRYARFVRRYHHGDPRPGSGIPLAIGLAAVLAVVASGLAAYLWLASR